MDSIRKAATGVANFVTTHVNAGVRAFKAADTRVQVAVGVVAGLALASLAAAITVGIYKAVKGKKSSGKSEVEKAEDVSKKLQATLVKATEVDKDNAALKAAQEANSDLATGLTAHKDALDAKAKLKADKDTPKKDLAKQVKDNNEAVKTTRSGLVGITKTAFKTEKELSKLLSKAENDVKKAEKKVKEDAKKLEKKAKEDTKKAGKKAKTDPKKKGETPPPAPGAQDESTEVPVPAPQTTGAPVPQTTDAPADANEQGNISTLAGQVYADVVSVTAGKVLKLEDFEDKVYANALTAGVRA